MILLANLTEIIAVTGLVIFVTYAIGVVIGVIVSIIRMFKG